MRKSDKKQPSEIPFKKDKFFIGVYFLVAIMLVVQVAIIVWGLL